MPDTGTRVAEVENAYQAVKPPLETLIMKPFGTFDIAGETTVGELSLVHTYQAWKR